jgi:hypothetical protein
MKNQVKYIIYSLCGEKYETDEKGRVIKFSNCHRLSNGLSKENATETELNTWIIRGIHEIKPFSQLGKLIPLSEAVQIKTFRFKNNHAKYAIADIDHGTKRVHGNWNFHGVEYIEAI